MKTTLKFKKKCNEQILAKFPVELIESELVDFALDCYIESLKNENPCITDKEIKEKIMEMISWRKRLSKI
ncbi:MAG: hypothetical protein QXN96_03970 [Candidatus Bathyarchaeia archaeon]